MRLLQLLKMVGESNNSYLRGKCWYLATVLHDRTGLPLYGIFDDNGNMHHAFVADVNHGVGFDARGETPLDSFHVGSAGTHIKPIEYDDLEKTGGYCTDEDYNEAEEFMHNMIDEIQPYLESISESRLDELRDIPKTEWASPTELDIWLKDNGWKRLDGGAFSHVYEKGGYILKIQKDTGFFVRTLARCLIQYHRMAMKSRNPHFPKVFMTNTYLDMEGYRRYVLGTEKLYPFDPGKVAIPQGVDPGVYLAAMRNTLSTTQYDDGFDDRLISMGYKGGLTKELLAAGEQYLKSGSELGNAYEAILGIIRGNESCFNDLHGANVMLRKDGTFVFSDPIGDMRSENDGGHRFNRKGS